MYLHIKKPSLLLKEKKTISLTNLLYRNLYDRNIYIYIWYKKLNGEHWIDLNIRIF